MSDATAARRLFGAGPLSRAVALIYTLLTVELLLLATTVPALIPLVLLDRDASNLPLVAVCAIPLGPAVAAALYAMRHRRSDLADLRPAAAYRQGYRLNLLPVLKFWIPWLAWLTVLAVNLAHFDAAGVPGWWLGLLVTIAVVAVLWLVNALVITSLFTFRTRDTARLAAHFLVRAPGVTLGNAGLVIVAAGVTAVTSEAVLALLASALVAALLRTSDPMIAELRRTFTA